MILIKYCIIIYILSLFSIQVFSQNNSNFEEFSSLFDDSFNRIPKELAVGVCKLDSFYLQIPDFEFYTKKSINTKHENRLFIFSISNLVGSDEWVFTFNKNDQLVDDLLLTSNADHDISYSKYVSEEYEILDENYIEIIKSTSWVKDSSLIDENGYLKQGDFIEYEKITLKDYKYYKIESTGKLIELSNLSHMGRERILKESSVRILRKTDLKTYSRNELRLIRNEIFAIHGYKFKSKDLDEYFSKKEWYNPIYEDVNEKLNDIERLNVQIIKSLE